MAKILALRAKNWPTRRLTPQTRQFLAALRLEFFNAIFQRRIFYNTHPLITLDGSIVEAFSSRLSTSLSVFIHDGLFP